MNHSPSVLLPYSIEGFFTPEEVDRVVKLMEQYKKSNPNQLSAGSRGISIHQNPNMTVTEVVNVYEPAGRVDVNTQHLPREIIDIAETAFYRRLEDIRRAYPGTYGPFGFTYVEYGVGQYFTAHADGVGGDQIAGFGITLTNDFDGGEFVVGTCGSNRLWALDDNDQAVLGPCPDASSEWFRSLPKTEWTTRPICGNAIFYGGALTHGSRPVTRGTLKKVLGFLR